jgi:transposase
MKTKNKVEAAAKRRVRAARLLQSGKKPAEVAALVGAPRQTVYRWRDVLESEGIDALRDMSKGGRRARLGAEELARLQLALLQGPTAHGFGTPLWTLKRLLGQLGFSSQKPERRALERDEVAIEH